MDRARRSAERLCRALSGRRVVFLGKAVAAAFGVRANSLRWVEHRGMTVAVLPHPSGVNTWWNNPDNRAAASAFMRCA